MINKYTITSRAARITGGVLELSKAQAAARSHALKALGNGRFEIVTTVEFKAGEVIGFEGDLPKALATCMENPGIAAARKKAKAQAKAEAEAKATTEAEAQAKAKAADK